jgi:hypothetical protein
MKNENKSVDATGETSITETRGNLKLRRIKERKEEYFQAFCERHCPPIVSVSLPGGEIIEF